MRLDDRQDCSNPTGSKKQQHANKTNHNKNRRTILFIVRDPCLAFTRNTPGDSYMLMEYDLEDDCYKPDIIMCNNSDFQGKSKIYDTFQIHWTNPDAICKLSQVISRRALIRTMTALRPDDKPEFPITTSDLAYLTLQIGHLDLIKPVELHNISGTIDKHNKSPIVMHRQGPIEKTRRMINAGGTRRNVQFITPGGKKKLMKFDIQDDGYKPDITDFDGQGILCNTIKIDDINIDAISKLSQVISRRALCRAMLAWIAFAGEDAVSMITASDLAYFTLQLDEIGDLDPNNPFKQLLEVSKIIDEHNERPIIIYPNEERPQSALKL